MSEAILQVEKSYCQGRIDGINFILPQLMQALASTHDDSLNLVEEMKVMLEKKYGHSRTDYGLKSESYWPLGEDILRVCEKYRSDDSLKRLREKVKARIENLHNYTLSEKSELEWVLSEIDSLEGKKKE